MIGRKKIQMENGVENYLYVVDGLLWVGWSRKVSIAYIYSVCWERNCHISLRFQTEGLAGRKDLR